jgi:hypothetical protein
MKRREESVTCRPIYHHPKLIKYPVDQLESCDQYNPTTRDIEMAGIGKKNLVSIVIVLQKYHNRKGPFS